MAHASSRHVLGKRRRRAGLIADKQTHLLGFWNKDVNQDYKARAMIKLNLEHKSMLG